MKSLRIYTKTILFSLLIVISSCGTVDPLVPDNPESTFSVSPETLEFTAAAGTKDVKVVCDGDWYVLSPGEDWCSAEKHVGTVLVDVKENTARQERTCHVVIGHETEVSYVIVTQAGRETDPSRPEVPEGGYTLNDGTVIAYSEVNALLDGGYDNGQWDKAFYLKKPVPEGQLPASGENWVFNTPSETFPDGRLAFIQEVKDMGDHYEVRYTDAGLNACFRDLNLPEQEMDITSHVTRIEDGNGRPLSFSITKAVSKSEPLELKIHPGTLSAGNLEIEPTISLSTVLKTRADTEDYRIYTLDFVVDTDCTLEMDYNVSAGVDVNFNLPILKVYMAAIAVGPLLITPFIEVDLTVGSCIQGGINAKYEYTRHIRASAHYDDMNNWSADVSSPAQDDGGWKPSRLGPKIECSTSYGVRFAPYFGLYGDVVTAGLGISAGMTHKVETGCRWNDPYHYNWVSILQDSEYSTAFNLGLYLSTTGLGFSRSIDLPELEFPISSCKILPTVSSVEQDCVGTQAQFTAWLKNK
ncbi:MAG: BACON domain-containing protein, partial [Bacteroidales bacterium]|nr:BACON domain-containing protein [Bacteroidales bacterium]